MSLRKCRKCKDEKSEDQFPEWGGKPGHVCADCKVPTGAAAQGKKKKLKLTKAVAAAPDPDLSLEFPAGFGFAANTRGDTFQIDRWPSEADGEAVSIVLSRAELATIFAHFGPWARP